MEKIFDLLYKRFFLRDFLSIGFCGFIVVLTIIYSNYKKIFNDTQITFLVGSTYSKSFMRMFLVLGLSYMVGLVIHILRDYFTYRRCGHKHFYREKFRFYKRECNNKELFVDEFERIVTIMCMLGNFGISIIISVIIFVVNRKVDILLGIGLVGLVGLVLFWLCWVMYRRHIDYLEEFKSS